MIYETCNPRMRCWECGFSTCFEHQLSWHEGLTFAEYDEVLDKKQKREVKEASQNYLNENTKGCPGCGIRVEKSNNMCDHMTCKFPDHLLT